MDLAKHIHFENIDSTNTWAKRHPHEWSAEGVTLITAHQQTAGRGRFKRQWISPPDLNIYATFCFWLDVQRPDIGHIPQLLALAAAQILEKHRFSPSIKWPNDLLLGGKKVGGILCETIVEKEKRGIVCGIGLNVNMPLEILREIDRPATSLFVERGHSFEVEEILKELQGQFLRDLDVFLQHGFDPFFPLFVQRSALKKGDFVRFHDHETVVEGWFETLHREGSVELRLASGEKKIFHAGEFLP